MAHIRLLRGQSGVRAILKRVSKTVETRQMSTACCGSQVRRTVWITGFKAQQAPTTGIVDQRGAAAVVNTDGFVRNSDTSTKRCIQATACAKSTDDVSIATNMEKHSNAQDSPGPDS
jgi:hypothetical protein